MHARYSGTRAARRSDVIREAAQQLGCGVAWVYVLLKRFTQDKRLTAFVPALPGPKPGRRLLAPVQEDVIKVAVEEFYLTRQQLKVSALMMTSVSAARSPASDRPADKPCNGESIHVDPPKCSVDEYAWPRSSNYVSGCPKGT